MFQVRDDDVFGFIHPAIDAHTLGISSVAEMLSECGYATVIADSDICTAAGKPQIPGNIERISEWIKNKRITRLGFSYRLDPNDGVESFNRLHYHLMRGQNSLRALYFAGLPATCSLIQQKHERDVPTFNGDETPAETLRKLGVPEHRIPRSITTNSEYDESRLEFGHKLIQSEKYKDIKPIDRSGYPEYGLDSDTIIARVQHGINSQLPPIMRAHVGPYSPRRTEAVLQFLEWTKQLADARLLDVLSIGTSQLSQSNFGENWDDKPNGGGVPINSVSEFCSIYKAARPMLVRTYSGTNNLDILAQIYEDSLNNAWHALSLWWFCRTDGRGPLTVRENLHQSFKTFKVIANANKPYEPNIPHHFAFRGADDASYIVSAILAIRAARQAGVRHVILQTMLNTPKHTWGVQDLAKAKVLLTLAQQTSDELNIILQPRAGLDFFSPDPEKAMAQLAAVSALMDDIEPDNPNSPPIIHVVSYSEAQKLADPSIVNESIQITRSAIETYRQNRKAGNTLSPENLDELKNREEILMHESQTILRSIEKHLNEPYTEEGLYRIFSSGYMPVPFLWECRDEFKHAVNWKTKLIQGSVKVVDSEDKPIPVEIRCGIAEENLKSLKF